MSSRVGALVVSKGFFEPQVIPPCGRDEITEPHVAHFVKDRVGTVLTLRECGGVARQEMFVERDAPGILHCAKVVFRHEHLIVGSPRKCHTVVLMIKVEALSGDSQNIVVVHERREGGATHQTQRDRDMCAVAGSTFPGTAVNYGPLACNNCGDVGGQRWCGKVVPNEGAGIRRCVDAVGRDSPFFRREDVEGPARLDIGLIHTRPGPARIGGLKLCVQVDAVIFRIEIAVEPLPCA